MNKKLDAILQSRGMNQRDLHREIKILFPRNPVMQSQLSRIISGKVKHYSTYTLYRLCIALNVTPNEILDFNHTTQNGNRTNF